MFSTSIASYLHQLGRNDPGAYQKLWADFFKEHPDLYEHATTHPDIRSVFVKWVEARLKQ